MQSRSARSKRTLNAAVAVSNLTATATPCSCRFAVQDKFWSSGRAQSLYKAHMHKLVNRKNTFNGITYKNDWAIFGEPRRTP